MVKNIYKKIGSEMKETVSVIILVFTHLSIMACELCKSHQPELLEDITHGMGPQGTIDYLIMWSSIVIVSLTLVFSVRYLIYPNRLDKKRDIKFLPISEFEFY